MPSDNRLKCAALAALSLAAALSLGGCSNRITPDSVRSDMSPELQSMAMTAEQRKNTHARALDTTARQFWDDLDFLLMIDQPSRLSIYPVP